MVKLTADLIGRSPFYINAIREQELDLRNNKISAIENLGATKVIFFLLSQFYYLFRYHLLTHIY